MAIQFLIDESMPGALSRAVTRHNQKGVFLIDAQKVGGAEAPAFGAPDGDLLMWMEQRGYILVSYDKKTLPTHFAAHLAAGGHVPGIFLFKLCHAIPFIVEYLATVTHASRPEEWRDRIVFVD
jgi:hypothetical protein